MRPILSIFVVASLASSLPAQDVSIFAPGSVSITGDNVFRGGFTPNGTSFYFFRKVTEGQEDYRIYRSTIEPEGWGEQVPVRLGEGEHSDLYPTVSPDGRRLVFSSYRPFPGDTASKPNANLWLSEWEGQSWGDPVPLTALSTVENYDAGPWFDDEGVLHWVSVAPDWRTRSPRLASELAEQGWEEDDLLAPWADWRDDLRVRGGRPSPDGRLMVLDVSVLTGGRPGPTDLWISRRTESGWSEPIRLGETVNTPDEFENFEVFSPDGRYLYFVRGFATYYRVAVADLPGG
jgi:hypothetical protein